MANTSFFGQSSAKPAQPVQAQRAPAVDAYGSGLRGVMVIAEDTAIKGKIGKGQRVEVYGYFDGDLTADTVIVHAEGRVFGTIKAAQADVSGTLQGEISVRQLIQIRSGGSVIGNVRYGELAMEQGGNLSAELRNVPPSLAGDFELVVSAGRSVKITTADLTALDPDDDPTTLTYSVSDARGGFVALSSQPSAAITSFRQSQIEAGQVMFVHDGSALKAASFNVVVTDAAGATSGRAQTMRVLVR